MPQAQTTFEVLLNPSVEEIDEERLAKHVRRLFTLFKSHLRIGLPVTTLDLMEYGKAQYNARVYSLRRILIPKGWCIDEEPGENGNNFYRLVRLGESKFYAKLKSEGKV